MVTRRTTMKTRMGTKPVVREAGDKLKEAQRLERKYAKVLRRKAVATGEVMRTRLDEAMTELRRVTHKLAKRVYDATSPVKPGAKRIVRKVGRAVTA